MRADRLVAILLLLQQRGQVTCAEVAEELEVSERTARRDLDALSMAGIPVYAVQGRGGGWRLAGGGRTVARVDVSVDGGASWRQAELLEDLGRWAWRHWRLVADLDAGRHELVVRAWDSAGALQPEDPASLWNPKGYVNNAWGRVVVDVR